VVQIYLKQIQDGGEKMRSKGKRSRPHSYENGQGRTLQLKCAASDGVQGTARR